MCPPFFPPSSPDKRDLRGTELWKASLVSVLFQGPQAMDVSQLRVNKLPEELLCCSLVTFGLKAEVAEQLQEALQAEEPDNELWKVKANEELR